MADQIKTRVFTDSLFQLVRETFEKVDGKYLDGGTSLFETLASVNAEQASQPIVAGGSTIAAHVFHIIFHLEVLERYSEEGLSGERPDWNSSWRVKTVNDAEWAALNESLRKTYQIANQQYLQQTDWNDRHFLEAAQAVVAHTAFHLGAIRQIALVVKQG